LLKFILQDKVGDVLQAGRMKALGLRESNSTKTRFHLVAPVPVNIEGRAVAEPLEIYTLKVLPQVLVLFP
jgi:hypothetical protein